MEPGVYKALMGIVGPLNVCEDESLLAQYGSDATKLFFKPDLVLFPSHPKEVAEVLKLANLHRFPVIPRGAGTGMSGGALPVSGGVVLEFGKMNRILDMDPKDGLCEVEPGAKTHEVQMEAKKLGLYYPPDPASAKESTIGGNIAECAGGLRAIKYGVTRDYVLGLEVVLPTGEIVKTGGRTLKGVAGYDLTRLMVGSEGTLGIITKAILRLIPLPQRRATILVCFPHPHVAIDSLFGTLRTGILPSAFEFMDHLSFSAIEDQMGLKTPYPNPCFVIVELDGREEQVKEDLRRLTPLLDSLGKVLALGYEDDVRWIWDLRRELSPSMYRLRPNKSSHDVVVPRSRLGDLLDAVEEISKETGLPIPVFGHLGDGNLHVNIMYDVGIDREREMLVTSTKRLLSTVVGMGGSISGEHGIGITKAPYLEMELGAINLSVMQAIKRALDPNNILNPYKIFYSQGLSLSSPKE